MRLYQQSTKVQSVAHYHKRTSLLVFFSPGADLGVRICIASGAKARQTRPRLDRPESGVLLRGYGKHPWIPLSPCHICGPELLISRLEMLHLIWTPRIPRLFLHRPAFSSSVPEGLWSDLETPPLGPFEKMSRKRLGIWQGCLVPLHQNIGETRDGAEEHTPAPSLFGPPRLWADEADPCVHQHPTSEIREVLLRRFVLFHSQGEDDQEKGVWWGPPLLGHSTP